MPKCTICTHKSRLEIEKLILRGESKRSVARQFGVFQDGRRHNQHDDEDKHRDDRAGSTVSPVGVDGPWHFEPIVTQRSQREEGEL